VFYIEYYSRRCNIYYNMYDYKINRINFVRSRSSLNDVMYSGVLASLLGREVRDRQRKRAGGHGQAGRQAKQVRFACSSGGATDGRTHPYVLYMPLLTSGVCRDGQAKCNCRNYVPYARKTSKSNRRGNNIF
jgi:hypothetical protein